MPSGPYHCHTSAGMALVRTTGHKSRSLTGWPKAGSCGWDHRTSLIHTFRPAFVCTASQSGEVQLGYKCTGAYQPVLICKAPNFRMAGHQRTQAHMPACMRQQACVP
eukprot:366569-Chlamydomonas_euryale.AAC.37